ncbi:phage tail sheath C-terminal domain-containing protein [Ligaoa zhengdingensis]|uniref:phage tail sheath C-terminal domain-containing protein n=1 Tax=Ligaoa zhengdingensis TaxID=2763658 RepID=UPI0031BA9625
MIFLGLPNINIEFKTAAGAAIKRSEKGVVGVIVRDAAVGLQGAHVMTSAAEIPSGLDSENKRYLAQAFTGYINAPRKVIAYVLGASEEFTSALSYFQTVEADYLAGPTPIGEDGEAAAAADADALAEWVKAQRADDATPKAVVPNSAKNNEGVINFTASNIKVGEGQVYSATQYCSRIAGLLAGTPMTISCTYAPLPEVADIERMTKSEMDEAIDDGKLILCHDGEKVKVARGVNSLTTTTQEKGAAFQKIKIVEVVDMLRKDIKRTVQDNYIGKYSNSYDNKCLLISAIKGYLETLELGGILQRGASQVGINLDAQRAYLKGAGVDVSALSDQEIKEADTADKVFLSARVKILDAIEDIDLQIAI